MNLKFLKTIQKFDVGLKKKLIVILLLSLIVFPLEFLSIAAVIPLFGAIFETTTSNSFFNLDFLSFEILGQNKVNNALLFIIILFTLKNFFLAIIYKLKFNYIFSIQKKLGHMIFFNNLSSNYNFYIKNDSSTAIRNIIGETQLFTQGYIQSLIDATLESLTLITIGIFLLIYSPQVTISLFIFLFGVTFFVDQVKKKTVIDAGLKKHEYNKYVLQLISGTFRGIKEIKANFLENKMFNLFGIKNDKKVTFDEKISFYSSIPKLVFELLCVVALSLIVYLNKDTEANIEEMIAVYAFATFRIMPSFVKLTLILQTIKLSKASINVIEKEYLNKKNEILKNIQRNNEMLIRIKDGDKNKFQKLRVNISEFKYDKDIILKNIDLKINRGDKICISGKSGSGKSTLVDIITGIINHENLKIFCDDKLIEDNLFFQKKNFSYIPQSPSIFQTTIRENITLFEDNIETEKYERALKLSRLDFVNNLLDKDKTILSENGDNISGGQLQRIFLARAIYTNKNILIFDESTNELDSKTENEIIDDIIKLPQTILLITHKEEIKKKFNKIFQVENIQKK
tara:strand:+ start:1283 stop:2992 length:1710 start_codon:yes stop_codon:yes gene_type:complete